MSVLLISSNRLGDAVLTTGAVPYLAAAYPNSAIVVACGALPAPLFEAMPQVSHVWLIRKRNFSAHWFHLWKSAIGKRWDHIVDLRGSGLSFFLAAKRRTIQMPDRQLRHRVLHLADTLKTTELLSPRLYWSADDDRKAETWIGMGQPTIALAPIANWVGKQWPIERFVELANLLPNQISDLRDARFLIAGGKDDRVAAQPLLDAIGERRVIDGFGLPLPEIAALLSKSDLFIGNDSGLMHMASAVGTPTIGLFGPSRDEHYAPWGEKCRVVRTTSSYGQLMPPPGAEHMLNESLMHEISVEQVVDAAVDLASKA